MQVTEQLLPWAVIGVSVLACLATAITWILLTLVKDRSASRYDAERHMATLSGMRDAYENQIGHLNAEMTATEQRWRDANHLLISAQNSQAARRPTGRAELTGFIRALGITETDAIIDPKLIVVLTPFSDEATATFAAIKAVCAEHGFLCVRGDEEFAQDVLTHIISLMVKARVVIANVGTRNANVFYELGIGQAIGKRTLLIAESVNKLEFDVQSQRILIYSNLDNLRAQMTGALLRAIAAVEE
jgi:hypothetical protein